MTTKEFTPEGWHTVTPRISVADPEGLINFLRAVFEATGEYRSDRPSVISIGDSMIMVGDSAARGVIPAFLYVYVSDADSTYERAIKSGATSIEAPENTPYGDRRCMIQDAWGNTWQVATFSGRSS